MDHIHPDQVVDVLDTPEKQSISNSVLLGKGRLSSEDKKNKLELECSDNVSRSPLYPPRDVSRSSKSSHFMASSSNSLRKKSLLTSKSSAGTDRDCDVVDLTSPVLRKALPSRLPEVTQPEEFRKVHGSHDCVHPVNNSIDAWKNGSSITLPKALRHKKLVQNGYMSSTNIAAKGKQPVGKNDGGFIGMGLCDSNHVSSNASSRQTDDARDVDSEGYNSQSLKGKGVLNHPFLTNGSARTSLRIHEKASEHGHASRGAVKKVAESDGWRAAHSQSRKLNTLVSSQSQNISTDNGGCSISGYNGSKVMRKENDNNGRTVHDNSNGQNSDASAQLARLTRSNLGPQYNDNNGCYMAKDTVVKRQKQGSASSGLAECSRSAADYSDIMFLGSSRHTTKSRLTENQNLNGIDIAESVIVIDEVSPEVRLVSSRAIGCNEDDTMTQVNKDEMLARELQEQFYSEDPAVGTGEQIDSHIALALQQDEESQRTMSRRRQPVSNPRERSSRNNPTRTGAQAPSSSRMATLRSRFPGQPHTSSSRGRNAAMFIARERNTLFPADMDLDMRLHILEALESFSNMGVGSSLLQMERDFNENDYEMLSALDENNHQHGGATTRQINGLPQSIVQSENLEEACAICLESPTVGDIIRHLPCLHKYHKDCIDPWLMRRTSCPICKSSIT